MTKIRVHPDCRNASNPYHECVEFCFLKIAELKESMEQPQSDGRVHLDCRNASNPYHECVEFCFLKIAESKEHMEQPESDVKLGKTIDGPASPDYPDQAEDHRVQESGREEHDNGDDDDHLVEENLDVKWRKRILELKLKMIEARKANQTAMVGKKKRLKASTESRGISKQKWINETKKNIGKQLDANGLDMKKACMLDTQETAEKKYNNWEKIPAPFGWDDAKQGRATDCPDYPNRAEDYHVQESDREDHDNGDNDHLVEENVEVGYTQLTGWRKRLFELKMNEARIADQTTMVAEKKRSEAPTESRGVSDSPSSSDYPDQAEDHCVHESGREEHDNGDNDHLVEENVEVGYTQLTGWRKRLFELKMNEARIADQTTMVAEKKRSEAPTESRGVSDSPASSDYPDQAEDHCVHESGREEHDNGDDDDDVYPLEENFEDEERKAMVAKKKSSEAPIDWDVDNQKTLYEAHNKRTKNIECNVDGEYNKKKEADPESYSDASSLQYGKAPKISEDTIDKMVKELHDNDDKRKEKDIDSINEHFNKKFERAFGKYTLTLEIKKNLESGIDLQDYVGAGLFTLCIGVGVLNCLWQCRQ